MSITSHRYSYITRYKFQYFWDHLHILCDISLCNTALNAPGSLRRETVPSLPRRRVSGRRAERIAGELSERRRPERVLCEELATGTPNTLKEIYESLFAKVRDSGLYPEAVGSLDLPTKAFTAGAKTLGRKLMYKRILHKFALAICSSAPMIGMREHELHFS
jgi:hypothetical protein